MKELRFYTNNILLTKNKVIKEEKRNTKRHEIYCDYVRYNFKVM